MFQFLKIKQALKTLSSTALALCLVSGNLHLDNHTHNNDHDEHSICNIGCDDGSHHSISDQCEKCLINDSNPIFEKTSKIVFNQKNQSLFSIHSKIINTLTDYTQYSRPPPR